MNPKVLIGPLAALAVLGAVALPAAAQDVTAEVKTWAGQSLRLSQPSLEVFYTIVPREEGPSKPSGTWPSSVSGSRTAPCPRTSPRRTSGTRRALCSTTGAAWMQTT